MRHRDLVLVAIALVALVLTAVISHGRGGIHYTNHIASACKAHGAVWINGERFTCQKHEGHGPED